MKKMLIFLWIGLATFLLAQSLEVRKSTPPYERVETSDMITAEVLDYEGQKAVKVRFSVSRFFGGTVNLEDYKLVSFTYKRDKISETTLLPTKFRSEYLNGVFDFSPFGMFVENKDMVSSGKKVKAYSLPPFREDTLELLFVIPPDLYSFGTLYAFERGEKRYLLWDKAIGFDIWEPYTKLAIVQALATARINSINFMRLLELYNAILAFESSNKAYLEPW